MTKASVAAPTSDALRFLRSLVSAKSEAGWPPKVSALIGALASASASEKVNVLE